MAFARRSIVSDISYDISFDVPSSADDSIKGNIVDLTPEIVDEHVLLPGNMLKEKGNVAKMSFTSSERGINRREGYVYTLFVPDRARCVFPCFDQPDMKASFSLSLTIPDNWKAVSNSCQQDDVIIGGGKKTITFAPTEPLSTYLFCICCRGFHKN